MERLINRHGETKMCTLKVVKGKVLQFLAALAKHNAVQESYNTT